MHNIKIFFSRIRFPQLTQKRVIILVSSFVILSTIGFIFREQISFLATKGADPVAYWTFDEGQGSTANDSTGNNDGSLGTGNSAPTWLAKDYCVSDKCLKFDGSNDYVVKTSSSVGATFVQECWNNLPSAASSLSIPCNTTAGNLLVLTIHSHTGSSRTYSVVDSGGNTWTNCTACEHRPSGIQNSGLLYYSLTSNSNTSIGITVTGGTVTMIGAVQEFSGIQASPFDVGAFGFSDTGSASIGTTATSVTAQANEIAVGHLSVDSASITITGTGSGWTYNTQHSGANESIVSGYKILSSTGAQTNTGTLSGSDLWTASVATFKAVTPSTDTLDPGTESFSVSTWFRHSSTVSGTDVLISRSNNAVNGIGYKVYMNSSGNICFGIDDDATSFPEDSACSSSSYSDSKWHNVQAVKSSTSSITLYIDGVEVAEDTSLSATGSLSGSSASVYVGIDGDRASSPWDGYVDDIKLYDYARTAEQIRQEYISRGTVNGTTAQLGDPGTGKGLSDGLVGYWKMDESSWSGAGAVTDSSGNLISGTAVGGAVPGTGKFGGGGAFDGSNDYVSVADSGSADPMRMSGATDLTISSWVKISNLSNSTQHFILSKYSFSSGQSGYSMLVNTAGTIRFDINGNFNTKTTTAAPISAGNWYNIVGVLRGGNKMEVYVNGALIESWDITPTTVTAYTSAAGIGSPSNNLGNDSFSLAGNIDEVRIYNRALDAGEVKALYEWAPGPKVYYKLDEGTGTTSVIDSSGNLAAGTLNGTVSNSNWVAGKFGKGLSLSGDDYITTNDTMSIQGQSQFSIAGWFYIRSLDGGGDQFYTEPIAASGNTRVSWGLNGSNQLSLSVRDDDGDGGVTNCITDSRSLTRNVWTHIAVVYNADDNDHISYINGVPFIDSGSGGCNNPFGTGVNATNKPKIGSNYNGSDDHLNGIIDDFKMYHYARTGAQIIEDMNAGHPAVGTPVGSAILDLKMNEGYGTTTYNAGIGGSILNGSFGTGSSAPTWTNAGKYGKALTFDGTNDYLQVSDTLALRFDGQILDFSLFAWVKKNLNGTNQYIISKEDADNDGWRLQFDSGNTVTCSVDSIDVTSSSTITDTNWHHIGCTLDRDGNGQVYIDGKANGSATSLNSENIATTANVRIGTRAYTSANYFSGSIDELKVYPFKLTGDHVKLEYNQGKSIVLGSKSTGVGGTTPDNSSSHEYCVPGDTSTCSAPVGEWKFNEGVGSSAYDTSTNGNTGTLTNGPKWVAGKKGKAISFNGINTYVALGNILEYSLPITISAWVKPNSLSQTFSVFTNDKTNTTHSGVWLEINTNGSFAINYGDNEGGNSSDRRTKTSSTGLISVNNWYHVTGVIRGATDMDLFLNGMIMSGTYSGTGSTLTYSTRTARIGQIHSSSNTANGLIDEVRMYNYSRTPAQIAWEFSKGAPVGYWSMDDCSDTTIDDWAPNGNGRYNGKNGLLTLGATGYTSAGTCTSSANTSWYNGRTGKRQASIALDGSSDYISISDDSSHDFGDSEDLSLSMWVKPSQTSTAKVFLAKKLGNSAGNEGYMLETFAGGSVGFEISDTSTSNRILVTTHHTLSIGNWHHIAVSYTAKTLPKIYINGILQTTITSGGGTISTMGSLASDNNLVIGAESDGQLPFYGQIDEVKLYRYALTKEQVRTDMNSGAVRFE